MVIDGNLIDVNHALRHLKVNSEDPDLDCPGNLTIDD